MLPWVTASNVGIMPVCCHGNNILHCYGNPWQVVTMVTSGSIKIVAVSCHGDCVLCCVSMVTYMCCRQLDGGLVLESLFLWQQMPIFIMHVMAR